MSDPDKRLIPVAAFLKRHLPGPRRATRADLLKWLGWYWTDARVGIVRERGRIVAVAMARCLHAIEDAENPFSHDEAGRIVWVEHIVSKHPQGVAALIGILVKRFGPRETLMGQAIKRDGELRKLPWNHVVQFFNVTSPHEQSDRSRSTCCA